MASREFMERQLKARSKMIVHNIKALPLPEKFRLVADFIDQGLFDFAEQTGAHAMSELAKAKPEKR